MKKNVLGVITFLMEYGVIILFCLGFQFSSDYTIRFMFLYFLIQFIFGHYTMQSVFIWEEVRLLITSHLCFYFSSLILLPIMYIDVEMMALNLFIVALMLVCSILFARCIRIMFRGYADKVLIIGTGSHALTLFNVCKDNRFSMNEVKGFISVNNETIFPGLTQVCHVTDEGPIYDVENVKKMISELAIDQVIIAVPEISKKHMDKLMELLHGKVKRIKYLPLAHGLVTFDSKIEDFDGLLLISTSQGNCPPCITYFIKRVVDIVGGLCGCLLILPLTCYVRYINHKYKDDEAVFFIQDRIGKNGTIFRMYKYRTMVLGAEQRLQELMEEDPAIRKEYVTNKKLEVDPRVTKAGKFLRSKSFDEVPQFLNVVKGEMSLVGPRPYLAGEQEDMGIYYESVIQTKPGITGMWQTHGRSNVSFEDRLKMDDYYCNNWSLWLDVTILVKTIKSVFSGEGAK